MPFVELRSVEQYVKSSMNAFNSKTKSNLPLISKDFTAYEWLKSMDLDKETINTLIKPTVYKTKGRDFI